MGVRERQLAVRAFRAQIWSPGRPSTAPRDHRVRFWEAIAGGIGSAQDPHCLEAVCAFIVAGSALTTCGCES
jgi:hypothetical protein